ncbi:MAG: hypothetical protein AAFP19_01255 [Bacteroidota bacterium]
MYASSIELREKKDRKRGLFWTFFFHALILGIALYPFMMQDNDPEPEAQAEFIVMDFTDFTPASREGAKPKNSAEKKEVNEKNAEKAVPKAKPVPKPKPTPSKAKKPVNTAPNAEPPVKSSPVEDPAPEEAPMEEPEPLVDEPKTPVETEKPTEKEATESNSKSSAGKTKTKPSAESGAGKGKTGDGTHDRGKNWGETAGEGIFNRKVIYRADVKKITKKAGKIVIDLCINRDGRVVMAKADNKASTIKDMSVVRKAVSLTTKYRFARDLSAPKKQCGTMTYVFEYHD